MRQYLVAAMAAFFFWGSIAHAVSDYRSSILYDSVNWSSLSGPMGYTALLQTDEMPGGSFSFLPFCSRTTPRGNHLIAQRFGYQGKGNCDNPICFSNKVDNEISGLAGNFGLLEVGADVQAIHFNVATTGSDPFRSRVFFRPSSTTLGLACSAHVPLRCWENGRLWLDLRAPLMVRNNRLELHESLANEALLPSTSTIGLDSMPFVGSIRSAVVQPNWRFGKMDTVDYRPDKMCKIGVGDIECTLGYSATCFHSLQFDCFGGLVFSGDSGQSAEWVYEPVLGNGGYPGFFAGFGGSGNVFEGKNVALSVHVSADVRYLFGRKQMRSFDVAGKSWSRYITLFPSYLEAERSAELNPSTIGSSGINHLTQQVTVHPGFCEQGVVAGHIDLGKCTIAVGCMGRASSCEVITGLCAPGGAIKSDSDREDQNISRTRTMRDPVWAGDLPRKFWDRAVLGVSDIEVKSGAREADVSGGLFVSCQYISHEKKHPLALSLGAMCDGLLGSSTIAPKWGIFGSLSLGL